MGDYEVIASGIIHLTEPEIKFDISGLVIKYKFSTDSEGSRFWAEIVDGELVISLYNFSNPLGEGKIEPIEVGTINGRKLFSTFFVNTPQGNNLRQFNYTFMLSGN
jgi:hypothetical protein